VWHGGHQGEADLLAGAYRSALEEAARIGARRVAFPAISTGIYGYPPDEAARVAVATLRAFDGPVDAVVLTAHPASARHPWDAALATPP
jgi:O-acetyl-ADP-ribose deacetylase (regulator of RNase III)